MLLALLLASVFAVAAPGGAQEVIDDMAPPVTEGVAAPGAQDQTDPNLPPGTVPTGIEEDTTDETVDHSTMGHATIATGSTSVTTDSTTETGTTGTTGTMTRRGQVRARRYSTSTRSEKRRVGKGGVSTCKSRWSPDP